MAEPFRARAKGKPWESAAAAFVREAVEVWMTVPVEETHDALAERGRQLLAQRCEDPLVVYLSARLQYRTTRDWQLVCQHPKNVGHLLGNDWKKAARAYEKALQDLEKAKAPRAVLRLVAIELANLYDWSTSTHNDARDAADRKAAGWLAEALAEGSYQPDEDILLVADVVDNPWQFHSRRSAEALAPIFEKSKLPEWARRTLLGYIEKQRAWNERGGGWASAVKAESWQGFAAHLALARAELTRAWELRPDRPEAAALMIGVVMGGHGGEGETLRTWFDRAVAAQFDYAAAYDAMRLALPPRWGGNVPELLAFGRACLATRRFDTGVPLNFIDAVTDATREARVDWKSLWREPRLAREIVDLSRGLASDPARRAEQPLWQSHLATRAWMAGDFVTAGRTLEELAGVLHPAASGELWRLHTSALAMHGETAVMTGAGAGDFAQAEAHFEQRNLAQARPLYEAALGKAARNDTATSWINERLSLLAFEEKFAEGDWTPLRPTGLRSWETIAGKWEATPDGTLLCHGEDAPALLVFEGRVGNAYELRADFEETVPPGARPALRGGVITCSRKAFSGIYFTCTTRDADNGKAVEAKLLDRFFAFKRAPAIKLPPAAKRQLLVRLIAGKLSYQLNGKPVIDGFDLRITPAAEERIGFGDASIPAGHVVRITNLEVRRISD